MAESPSCPRCTLITRVERIGKPETSAGRTVTPLPWSYWCGGCNLAFKGTDSEWAQMGPVRQEIRERADADAERARDYNEAARAALVRGATA